MVPAGVFRVATMWRLAQNAIHRAFVPCTQEPFAT